MAKLKRKRKWEVITERKIGGFHPDSGVMKRSRYTTFADSEGDARGIIRFRLQGKRRQEVIISVTEIVDGKEDKLEDGEGKELDGADIKTDIVPPGKTKKAEKKKKRGKAESESPESDEQDWGENF